MDIIHLTLEREPLQIVDGPNKLQFTIGEINIGIREGTAFRLRTDEIYRDSDPWFCVLLNYERSQQVRPDGSNDYDYIVTNGDEYWRVRRSLGRSPLQLTSQVVDSISRTITEWCNPSKKADTYG